MAQSHEVWVQRIHPPFVASNRQVYWPRFASARPMSLCSTLKAWLDAILLSGCAGCWDCLSAKLLFGQMINTKAI